MILTKAVDTSLLSKPQSSSNPRGQEFASGKKVFQFCEDCLTETIHYTDGVDVVCYLCGYSYALRKQYIPKSIVLSKTSPIFAIQRNKFFLI